MPDHPLARLLIAIVGPPLLVIVCLFFVIVVVDASRRSLGDTKVNYRPLRNRIADWVLISRLWRNK